MSEQLYPAIIGLVVGLFSFPLSKMFEYTVYKPLDRLDEKRTQINSDIAFWANVYSNPSHIKDREIKLAAAQECFRRHSADIAIFWYKGRVFHLVNEEVNGIDKRSIDECVGLLMRVSNRIGSENIREIHDDFDLIRRKLRLKSNL